MVNTNLKNDDGYCIEMIFTEMILLYSGIKLKKIVIDAIKLIDSVSEINHSRIKTENIKCKYCIQEYN